MPLTADGCAQQQAIVKIQIQWNIMQENQTDDHDS